METEFTERDNCLFVVPHERLDTITSPNAQETLTKKIEDGARRVIFDFQQTDYVSSAGLRVILVARKLLQKAGGRVALCNANDQILEVLEISGFNAMVQHHANVADALKSIGS